MPDSGRNPKTCQKNRNRIRAGFLLAASLQVLVPLLLTRVCYMETDDYLLNYIANGSYGTEGSAHLVYVRIIFGKILQLLYRYIPGVNWYAAMLAAAVILALTVYYICIREMTGSWYLLIPVFFWGFLIVPFYFSFTTAAFLTVGAGAAALSCLFYRGGHPAEYILAVCMITGGSQIRWDTLRIALAIMFPLLAAGFLKSLKKRFLRSSISLLALLLLVFLSRELENRAYRDPEWRSFREYTFARSSVNDHYFASDGKSMAAYAEAGLTALDCEMLTNWLFCEKPVFSSERLRAVGKISAQGVTTGIRKRYMKSLVNPRNVCLILMVPLMLALLIITRRGRRFERFAIPVIWLLAAFGLSWVRMRFVARVALPVTLTALFATALSGSAEEAPDAGVPGTGRRILSGTLLAALIFTGIIFTVDYAGVTKVKRSFEKMEEKQALLDQVKSDGDTLYIADGNVLNPLLYYGVDVKDVRTTDDFRNLVRAGSWDSFSPRYYEQVRQFLPDQDRLLTSLVTAENTAYLSTGDRMMRLFLSEQTGAVFSETEEDAPEGIYIVRRTEVPGLQTKIYTYERKS